MYYDWFKTLNASLKKYKQKQLVQILLPKYKLLHGGEQFVENLYKTIDECKFQLMIVNYTLEDDSLSNMYLQKLIKAQQRGVQVFLFIDKLVSKPNKQLLKELKKTGGNILYWNKKQRILNSLNRSYFQRDHEKIILSDNKILLGSANISKDYGGKWYGNDFFFDLNILVENCAIKDTLKFFQTLKQDLRTKDQIKFKNYNHWQEHLSLFPDSVFASKTFLLRTFFPYFDEIQLSLLAKIQNAKKEIKIINPYYYTVEILEKEILRAAKRGVNVEILTSKKRDVPCYNIFQNWQLFKNYEKSNVKIYEYDKHYLHAKALTIDNKNLIIGSFNMDQYSWYGNNEIMLDVSESKQIINDFNTSYHLLKQQSQEISFQNKSLTFKEKILTTFWTGFLYLVDKTLIHWNFYNSFIRKTNKEN